MPLFSKKFSLALFTAPLCIFTLVSCNPVEELEADCLAGDNDACEILSTIDEAVAELEQAIPEGVTLASVFEEIEDTVSESDLTDYSTAGKETRIENTLDPANIKARGLIGCLRALPPKPPARDPICYGPKMDYVNHPDSANKSASGQLPQGDLGIWLDTEPTANGKGRAPCAAVKMRELVAKSLHNIDMATGSVAMMMCAAAHEKVAAPKNDGDVLDFANLLNGIADSPFTVTTATLTRVDENTLKAVFVAEHNGGRDNRLGSLSISSTHNRESKTGLIQIERRPHNESGIVVATSARYQPKPNTTSTKQVQVLRGRFDTAQMSDFYNTNGDVKLGPISKADGASRRNIENTRYFLAEFDRENQTQNIAFGWNAGGNDSHFRAFNADANGTTADAWYGYVPNPYANGSSVVASDEKPNLDLGADDAGMICNWAGPGNSHTVNNYLQHQSMVKNTNDRWTLATSGGSLIRYVPTKACELTSNTNATFTAALNPNQTTHAPSFAAHDIAAGETFTQSTSNTVGLDAKSNHNITIPTSW